MIIENIVILTIDIVIIIYSIVSIDVFSTWSSVGVGICTSLCTARTSGPPNWDTLIARITVLPTLLTDCMIHCNSRMWPTWTLCFDVEETPMTYFFSLVFTQASSGIPFMTQLCCLLSCIRVMHIASIRLVNSDNSTTLTQVTYERRRDSLNNGRGIRRYTFSWVANKLMIA